MSLNKVWEAASASPYSPLISKDHQFSVGFTLLLSGKHFELIESISVRITDRAGSLYPNRSLWSELVFSYPTENSQSYNSCQTVPSPVSRHSVFLRHWHLGMTLSIALH
jgi:hypothetical protein